MKMEMLKRVKEVRQEAAELVRYANPRSRIRPTYEWVVEKMVRHIPYGCGARPVIKSVTVKSYECNRIIKTARFLVETESRGTWEITAYEDRVARTPAEREADKEASFPSGLFKIFHDKVEVSA